MPESPRRHRSAIGGPAPRISTVALPSGILACLLFGTLGPGRSTAAEFPVSDPGSFQAALTTAATNGQDDVVTVAAGTYLLSAPLVYSSAEGSSITIRGAGTATTVLDGQDTTRTLEVSTAAGAILVEDLGFARGSTTSGDGGALRLESGSGTVTLRGCDVADSEVGGENVGGGASVFSDSGSVTVEDCRFLRNTSEANVGGLYAATTTGSVTVDASRFEDNAVDNLGGQSNFGDGGGAMVYADDGGTALVRDCVFERNTTTGGDNPDGGGLMIYLLGTNASATVEGSTFTDNEADLGGGGFFVRLNGSGSITARDNRATGNDATGGEGGGAFLYLDTGTLVVEGNTVTSNTAGTDGGGLWIRHSTGTATLTGNRFDDNEAGGLGGGLHLGTDSAATTMSGNAFWKNTADGVGGGFSYATGDGSLDLERTTTHANSAPGGAGIYLYLDQASAPTALTSLALWGDVPDELDFSTGRGPPVLEVLYSTVQGANGEPWLGTGSLDEDPRFVDGDGGDLSLSWPGFPDEGDPDRSPAIDSGDPTAEPIPTAPAPTWAPSPSTGPRCSSPTGSRRGTPRPGGSDRAGPSRGGRPDREAVSYSTAERISSASPLAHISASTSSIRGRRFLAADSFESPIRIGFELAAWSEATISPSRSRARTFDIPMIRSSAKRSMRPLASFRMFCLSDVAVSVRNVPSSIAASITGPELEPVTTPRVCSERSANVSHRSPSGKSSRRWKKATVIR